MAPRITVLILGLACIAGGYAIGRHITDRAWVNEANNKSSECDDAISAVKSKVPAGSEFLHVLEAIGYYPAVLPDVGLKFSPTVEVFGTQNKPEDHYDISNRSDHICIHGKMKSFPLIFAVIEDRSGERRAQLFSREGILIKQEASTRVEPKPTQRPSP